ncbi:preprotein translocase subunit YajC [Clavibacter michiganensis]|uniref:preprotein translocase subunit YajC n=1 Tax=Clavibacter michiganensis TaxID=28447 RepID=UPI001D30A74D|nr:preprotein translocase subunit YajC [Clavibacter michiganensis]MBM7410993.1 preprotein translocase subunit YajC [Clavibacter michiganensis]
MDPFTLIMFAVLALLIFFMFRNSRKRQKDLAELQTQMVPGAEVMTASGIYGTLVSFDEENNLAYLEVAPGTVLKLHRQTIARVVEPTVADDASVLVDDAPAADAVDETGTSDVPRRIDDGDAPTARS